MKNINKWKTWKDSVAKNILANWVGYAVSIVVAFFLSPFVVHNLGDEKYGLWVFIGSVTGYMGLLDMGVRSAVTQYVSKFNAIKAGNEINSLCSTAIIVYITMGVLSICFGFLLAKNISYILPDAELFIDSVQIAIFIVSCEIAIMLSLNVFGGIVIGLQRFEISQGISIIVILLRAIGTIVILLKGYGIVGLAFVSICSTLVGNLIQSFSAYKLLENLRISVKFFNKDDCRRLFGFGIAMFVIHISGQIIYYTDIVVIGMFGSSTQITHYAIAGNLIDYSAALLSGISVVLFPKASEQNARNDYNGLQQSLILGTRLTLCIGIPILLSFIFIGKEFIVLWMGEKFAETSPIVLSILSVGTIIRISQINSVSILAGMHRQKFLAYCMVVEAVANLLLSIFLMKIYGIYGVAIGTTVPIIIMRIFFVGRHVAKITKLDFKKYLMGTIVWSLGNGIFFLIPLLILHQFPLDSWTKLSASIFISSIIYLTYLYYVGLNEDERRRIHNIYKNV